MSELISPASKPQRLARRRTAIAILVTTVAALQPSSAQEAAEGDPGTREFSFARVEYDSTGGMGEAYYYYDGRYWRRWETDYPQADQNFLFRFRELTTTHSDAEPVTRRLSDPEIFAFPFLYMCDAGWMDLDELETVQLREYLLKGGFLWIDDFWGQAEWQNVERIMQKVLPQHSWRDLPPDHPILSLVYELDNLPQVPARDFAALGHDPPDIHRYPAGSVTPANFRGYFDDQGRLMVVATHNTDIGDGWEREAYGEWYFEKYSTVSYATGVNIVVYGMSH